MKFMVIEGCVSRTIDRRLVNLGNILQEGWFWDSCDFESLLRY